MKIIRTDKVSVDIVKKVTYNNLDISKFHIVTDNPLQVSAICNFKEVITDFEVRQHELIELECKGILKIILKTSGQANVIISLVR